MALALDHLQVLRLAELVRGNDHEIRAQPRARAK